MKSTVLRLALLIYFVVPQLLLASGLESNRQDRIFVIQEKIFHRHHEAGIFIPYIPDDDFVDSYGVGANYTYHFNDAFSWEVFRASWLMNQDKSIRGDIQNSLNISPTFYDEPNYMLFSQLWFRPLYGKSTVRNKSIIFHETGIFLGAFNCAVLIAAITGTASKRTAGGN